MRTIPMLAAAVVLAGAVTAPATAEATGGWVIHGTAGSHGAIVYVKAGTVPDFAAKTVTMTGTYLLVTLNPYVKRPYAVDPPAPPATPDTTPVTDDLEWAYVRYSAWYRRTGATLAPPQPLAGVAHAFRIVTDGDFEIRIPVPAFSSWHDVAATYRADGHAVASTPPAGRVIQDSLEAPVMGNSVTVQLAGVDTTDYVADAVRVCMALLPGDACATQRSYSVLGAGGPNVPPIAETHGRIGVNWYPGDLPSARLYATMADVAAAEVTAAYHLVLTVSLDWIRE